MEPTETIISTDKTTTFIVHRMKFNQILSEANLQDPLRDLI